MEGKVTDKTTNDNLNDVNIEILHTEITNKSVKSIHNGTYKTGTADIGTYSIVFSKKNYIQHTETINLEKNGEVQVLNVTLKKM